VHFIGFDFVAQGGVHTLVALNEALAFKLSRHQGGVPMTAIAFDVQMLTGQTCGDEGLELFSSH
jgi:hypothetical protein